MFHDSGQLEQLAKEVQEKHALRLDAPEDIPMVPRPFVPQPRPRTALISQAAQARIDMRQVLANALARWR